MSFPDIHPTALVRSGTKIGKGVKIGAFSIVGDDVILRDNVELVSHVSLAGRIEIGAATTLHPFVSLGQPPQDLKYRGELSRIVIGERCSIREFVTINPGTEGGGMVTRIGDDCLIMANAHVAHDCQVGNNVVLASYVGLAGHCIIGDHVSFGGMCAVHQFVRIGAHAFVGAQSMIDSDVIPYGMAVGNRARLAGLNLVGMKRRGFARETIHALRAAYRMIFATEGTLRERLDDTAEMFRGEKLVQDVVQFIASANDRSILLPRNSQANE